MTSPVLHLSIDGSPSPGLGTAIVTLVDVFFEVLALVVSLALASSLTT
jgi:hypothetical protein